MDISWFQRVKETVEKDYLELAGAASLLLLLLLVFFWSAIFSGQVLLPADLVFDLDPLWRPIAPEGYTGPTNSISADQVYQFYPWEVFARQSLAKGQLPLWNPYTDAGTPFIGNALSAVFSPFTLIGYLFPLHTSYIVKTISRLFLAGIFTFLFAREIDINLSGALLAMVTFTFSGPMVVWLGHPNSLVAAWLPAMLFTTERMLTRKSTKYVVLSALIIGAQFLGGHPETSFHVMLAWMTYALYRMILLEGSHPSQWLPHFLRIGFAASAGILLAAIQLLPFIEALCNSATLSARATETSGSTSSFIAHLLFDWHEWPTIITTLLPNYFGMPLNDSYWFPYSNYVEQNAYVGILPLVLASTIVLRYVHVPNKASHKRNQVLFFGSMALISLGVALHLPGFNIVNALPLFDLAANERLRLIYALAIAILAGLGVDAMITDTSSKFCRSAIYILGILALGSTALIIITYIGFIAFKDSLIQSGRDFMKANWNTTPYLSRSLDYYYDLVKQRYQNKLALFHPNNIVMYMPVLVSLTWGAILRWKQKVNIKSRIWHYAILSLTIVDLFVVGMPFNPTLAPENIFPIPDPIHFLREDQSIYRISGTDLILYPNSSMLFDLYDIRGYETIVPSRYVNLIDSLEGHYRFHFHSLFRQTSSPLWDLLNVKYILTDKDLEGKWVLVYQDESSIKIYRNRNVLPRAFVVHHAVIADNADQSLEQVLDPAFDFREKVVLEKKPAGWGETPANFTSTDSVRIVNYRPNHITMDVQTTSKGLLVLTDTYTPGWKAFVDGHPTPVYVANHAFRAITIPDGHHQVEFIYRPWSFYVGAILSLCTLITLGVSFFLSRYKQTTTKQ
jgi:hypothetical protein